MVGDGPEADSGTAAFCAYWEDSAALTGSVLVYNTGRSLGQFTGLWASKGGTLALPDVLITAVGTKARALEPTYIPTCLCADSCYASHLPHASATARMHGAQTLLANTFLPPLSS